MNIEIPEFLIEMSKQINSQNNRSTAEPIFQVCFDEPVLTPEGYNNEYFEIIDYSSGEQETIYSSDRKTQYNDDYCCSYLIDNYPEYVEKWMADSVYDEDESFSDIFDPDDCDEDLFPEEINKLYFHKSMKVVKSCLTEHDAKAFIARKQHDYRKLYIYVNSMVFCPQMIELRRWIMSLTGDNHEK